MKKKTVAEKMCFFFVAWLVECDEIKMKSYGNVMKKIWQ